MQFRRDAGQTSIEWLGIAAVLVAFIGAFVAFTDIGQNLAENVSDQLCRVTGQADCAPSSGDPVAGDDQEPNGTTPDAEADDDEEDAEDQDAEDQDAEDQVPDPPVNPRTQAAQDRLDAASGPATLENEIQAAIDAGDLAAAEELLDRLELIDALVADDERGPFVDDLFNLSDEEFADLIADGTIYLENGKYNTAYFQMDNPPGGGVVVMDYFIEGSSSLGLAGDDRDHQDPFGNDLPLEDSRVMIIVDLETGRGQVLQTETCIQGGGICNEPRPIVFDGSFISNDRGNDQTGEGINLDQNNQYEIERTEDGFRINYDALNSITPTGSIDGGVNVVVAPDGQSISLEDDDRENYPSIGTYYYPPGEDPQVVQQREQEGVICGAIVVINNLC